MNNRSRATAGLSTIATTLGAAFLLAVVLAFTMIMSVSALRTTADGTRTLSAQYAAESGLSHGAAKLALVNQMIEPNSIKLDRANTAKIQSYVTAFCGSLSSSRFTQAEKDAGMDQRYTGVDSCLAPLKNTNVTRFDILAENLTADAYRPLLRQNNPDQSNAWIDETAHQMAGETNGPSIGWALEQRRAWWNGFLGKETLRSTSAPTFAADVQVRPYAVRAYKEGSTIVGYRFIFKSELASEGYATGDTSSRRVVVASAPDDNQGLFSFDLGVWAPAMFLDSARSKDGYSYSGNISNLLGVENRVENSYSKYNDASFNNPKLFDAQFRNGIYSQEKFVGDLHTNEFLTFDERNGRATKVAGRVTSAGCVRNPVKTNTVSEELNFSAADCLLFKQNAFGREVTAETIRVFNMEKLIKDTLGARYDTLTAAKKNQLLAQQLQINHGGIRENRWDGTDTIFSQTPDFAASFVKLFDFEKEGWARNGLADKDLVRRRNASKGLDINGHATDTIGLNIEDLYASIWKSAGGDSTGSAARPKEFNTTVRLRAASEFKDPWLVPYRVMPSDTGKFTWDAAQQRYTLPGGARAQYQYIEITPSRTPGLTPGTWCVTPRPMTFRVDKAGNMEIWHFDTAAGLKTMYSCEPVKKAGSGHWVPYAPGRKFNGIIYSDGNIQLTQAKNPNPAIEGIDETTKRRIGHILPGGRENMYPAIASFQKLEIGAGQKVHIPRDLILEDLPCTTATCIKATPVNSLSIHAADNVELSDEVTPFAYQPNNPVLYASIPTPIIRNLSIDGTIISSQGELRNKSNFVESGTSGALPFLRDLNIFGSIATKFNGQVGRYMPSTNDFRGYRRNVQIDPRIASGVWVPKTSSTSSFSPWQAMNPQGSAVPELMKEGY